MRRRATCGRSRRAWLRSRGLVGGPGDDDELELGVALRHVEPKVERELAPVAVDHHGLEVSTLVSAKVSKESRPRRLDRGARMTGSVMDERRQSPAGTPIAVRPRASFELGSSATSGRRPHWPSSSACSGRADALSTQRSPRQPVCALRPSNASDAWCFHRSEIRAPTVLPCELPRQPRRAHGRAVFSRRRFSWLCARTGERGRENRRALGEERLNPRRFRPPVPARLPPARV